MRPERLDGPQPLGHAPALGQYLEIGFELQELLEAFEHQWMVVNQDQANWCIATRPVPAAA